MLGQLPLHKCKNNVIKSDRIKFESLILWHQKRFNLSTRSIISVIRHILLGPFIGFFKRVIILIGCEPFLENRLPVIYVFTLLIDSNI